MISEAKTAGAGGSATAEGWEAVLAGAEDRELPRTKGNLAILSRKWKAPRARAEEGRKGRPAKGRGRKRGYRRQPRKVRPTREPRRELCDFAATLGRPLFEHLNPLARLPVGHCRHKRSDVTIPVSGHFPLNVLNRNLQTSGHANRSNRSSITAISSEMPLFSPTANRLSRPRDPRRGGQQRRPQVRSLIEGRRPGSGAWPSRRRSIRLPDSRASLPSLRLFSANLQSGPPSPCKIGPHQTTVTVTQGAVDLTEGFRSLVQ
jgi:hypothetical protein